MTDTTDETDALIQTWIKTFCEIPVLVDTALMREVLNNRPAAEDRS